MKGLSFFAEVLKRNLKPVRKGRETELLWVQIYMYVAKSKIHTRISKRVTTTCNDVKQIVHVRLQSTQNINSH